MSLMGDAAQIVSTLLVTDANNDNAERKLEERYINKHSLVKTHLATIHALPCHVQALDALMSINGL